MSTIRVRTRPHPRPLRRLRTFVVLLIAVGVMGGNGPAEPQEIDAVKAARVKAAYLYNFINLPFNFVKWPAPAFASDVSPMVIGIVGEDPLAEILDQTVEGKKIEGRKIVVRRFGILPERSDDPQLLAAVKEMRRCHLLFVGGPRPVDLRRACEAVRNAPVLTVSDVERFAETGGMIELALDRGRIIPRINRRVAEAASLRLSAKLLRLAQLVETPP
ncbi:MAG: YfiR family protein [Phycisphaerales bacterium]|nr:YfiR family protein [Phycisphaerae bacterium]NNF42289.1 YfiR family protein [Phycisphaerales bacterium]NNM26941.1 YfiR family protein [Phycisphaerales bacterium]